MIFNLCYKLDDLDSEKYSFRKDFDTTKSKPFFFCNFIDLFVVNINFSLLEYDIG